MKNQLVVLAVMSFGVIAAASPLQLSSANHAELASALSLSSMGQGTLATAMASPPPAPSSSPAATPSQPNSFNAPPSIIPPPVDPLSEQIAQTDSAAPSSTAAKPVESTISPNDSSTHYFDKDNVPLTPEEKTALHIAADWRNTAKAAMPLTGKVGEVVYVYGDSFPSILCEPLQVTDIALECGEQITSPLQIGDKVRWQVNEVTSGCGIGMQTHIIVKPTDVGLSTSMVVTTDRRTYYFRLKSLADHYMPRVAFLYPDTLAARKLLSAQQAAQQKALLDAQALQARQAREAVENLNTQIAARRKDFDYVMHGFAPWKPTEIWNDGVKTYIRLPRSTQEEPSLLVIRDSYGGWFHKSETVLVNYRVQNNLYIVDFVIDHGVLEIGVGKMQEKVEFRHTTPLLYQPIPHYLVRTEKPASTPSLTTTAK